MEKSILYTTRDGGTTWNMAPNFIDSNKLKSCSIVSLETPQFVELNTNQGFIPLGCITESGSKFNGLFTTNKGHSWELVPFDLSWNNGINQLLSPIFINNSEGWYLQDSQFYHTVDQGKSWTALPISKVLLRYMESYPIVVKVNFTSSDVGWILLENRDDKRSLLLQTKNGGVSWKVL
ncbi:Ycf48-like protein [compost metagenome]